MQCVAVSAELFRYDDELNHAVPVEIDVEGPALDLLRRAVLACPEQAITLDQEPDQ